ACLPSDIRRELRASTQLVHRHLPPILETSERVVRAANERLPPILANTDRMTKLVNDNLPKTMARVDTLTEVFTEMAEDVKQLKELWVGLYAHAPHKTLVAYPPTVLTLTQPPPPPPALTH